MRPAEAAKMVEVGTNALRDELPIKPPGLERAIAAMTAYILAHARLAEALVDLDTLTGPRTNCCASAEPTSRLCQSSTHFTSTDHAPPATILQIKSDFYKQIANTAAAVTKP